jgi:hypothetical protein
LFVCFFVVELLGASQQKHQKKLLEKKHVENVLQKEKKKTSMSFFSVIVSNAFFGRFST